MRKTTLVKGHCLFFVLALFSFVLTAGNNTPPTSAAFSKNLNSEDDHFKSAEQLCTITAPTDAFGQTSDDGSGNCSTQVALGTPEVSDCAGFPAKAFVNNTEIDPDTYLFPTGTTIVIWQISDGLSVVASDQQEVVVTDNEEPEITCIPDQNRNTDPASCAYLVAGTEFDPTGYSDNCPGTTIINDFNNSNSLAGASFPEGTITVTWTVTDVTGNFQTCSFDVVITDNENPTITAPADVSVSTDSDDCIASGVILGTPVTNDNCSVVSVTNDAPATFSVGNTTVTWTVRDAGGNQNTMTQTVSVSDKEVPEITAPANVTVSTDPGDCISSGVNLGSPVTNDNCSVASVTNNAPVTFPLGDTEVIWTVTDATGNQNTVTQTVSVSDNEAPEIAAPTDVSVITDPGDCIASGVDLGTPVTNDNCSIASVTNDAPATFPVGSTAVTWTITDAAGNENTAVQSVSVSDNETPEITAPADISVTTDPGDCIASGVDLGTPVTNDNCSVASVTNNAPATFSLGDTEVIWTVTDAAGNENTAIQTVSVSDNEAPEITAPVDVYVTTDGGACTASGVSLGSPVTSDNCGLQSVSNNAPVIFPLGNTIITWTVTDDSGNTNTATQMVRVEDDENPTITAPADVTARTSDDGKGNCTSTAVLGTPLVSENCGIQSIKTFVSGVEIDPATHIFQIGTTQVLWEITDNSGNKNSAEQSVTIVDDEAPIQPKVNHIIRGCAYTVSPPTATDNCDSNVTITANRSTTFTQSGTIVWTFSDDEGNSSSVSQNITINDLVATTSSTRTSVYEVNDGTATANPSGGTAPYSYEWRALGSASLISSARQATNLAAGDYEVKITDATGCHITEGVTVISAVRPDILATSECASVHDYIRTSTFQIDLDNITGGIGDPQNYNYEWNFGVGATPSSATGPQEFTVTWDSEGDKIIELTITDEGNFPQTYEIEHYVGGCFEGCGTSVNFDLNTDNFFIGDKDGNRLTGANCEQTTEKYMWIEITKNANGYGLSSELYYAVNNGTETISRKAIGCFEEIDDPSIPTYKPIPLGLFRLFQVQETDAAGDKITWKCGETFKVLQLNIRWTNEIRRGCNEGTKPMCYGPSEEVIVHTPLMADATATNILCKGESSGSITINASGGLAPNSYSISGPVTRPYQASNVFYNLPAGTYTYSVKDSDDQITAGTITITEPASAIDATISVTQQVECYGGTGTATITGQGGTLPYTYSWNSGATTQTATGLYAGTTYTATVTDANGCSITKPITLTPPAQLTLANAGNPQNIGCGIYSTTLSGNTPASGEKGEWRIVSGAGGSISGTDLSDPNAPFSGIAGETYTLEWTISRSSDGSCPNSDTVSITFAEECSTLNFDGIDDHVVVGDHYDFPTSEFTLEAWIRPESISGTKTIVSKRNTANFASGGYDLSVINGAISFRWNGNQVLTTLKVGIDRWYHIAVVFQGEAPKIYVDGINIPVQTGIPVVANPTAINHPFIIGAAYYSGTPQNPKSYFQGWIEEVRIWDTALTEEQLRFMMNQRIEESTNEAGNAVVKGEVLPMNVPGALLWSHLKGYYRLLVTEIDANLGTTPDIASNNPGYLKNIEDSQENSAPLPYISLNDGNWWNTNSWLEPDYWDPPNSIGIDGTKIDWNIAYVSEELHSGNENITLLGLLLKGGKLDMLGTNPTSVNQPGTGNALTITTYLELDGFIDLNGESQLLQTEGSILAGVGRLDRDQQGTGSSFNYNYFSSPVSTLGNSQNSGYTIAGVLRSGTDPASPSDINFNYQYHYADGPLSDPLKISTYWLYKFHGDAGLYNEWQWIGQNGYLNAAEGFTMKGSSGHKGILELQNYVFTGMPNNGSVSVNISAGQNRLIGNPYPSAIDADEFIKDNLEGRRDDNVFNGTLYFWSHFSGKTHYLQRYVGGYATYNLAGGVKAVSNDARINATGEIGGMEPKQYIPPGQAFFINTVVDESVTNWASKLPQPVGITGGEVKFNNSQRVFQKEDPAKAVFHTTEKPRISGTSKNAVSNKPEEKQELRKRIWIKGKTPSGYHRQLLVTEDESCSPGFDLGYDAPLYDHVDEDMFWQTNGTELVIQGVPGFDKETELPLTLKVAQEGEFMISIDELENIPDNFAIHLKDTTQTETIDLRKSSYQFEAKPGLIKNRFSIVFLNEKQSKEDEYPEELESLEIKLFFSNNENKITILNPDLIKVDKAYIYTLSGQFVRMYDYVPLEDKTDLIVPLETNGVYVLHLETANGKKSMKFVLKK